MRQKIRRLGLEVVEQDRSVCTTTSIPLQCRRVLETPCKILRTLEGLDALGNSLLECT